MLPKSEKLDHGLDWGGEGMKPSEKGVESARGWIYRQPRSEPRSIHPSFHPGYRKQRLSSLLWSLSVSTDVYVDHCRRADCAFEPEE